MKDFTFNVPTKIIFGRNCLDSLAEGIKEYGSHVLLVYGGGSIKKIGLYDKVLGILNEKGIGYAEVSGVQPNPRIESVREGIKTARENKCDVVLAIGGGSSIDCAKAIAAGAEYDGDVWDLITKKQPVGKVLPVLTIQTLAGTGSEMSTSSVISKIDSKEKYGFSNKNMRPKISFMNPEYTFTLPKKQTAAGIADAFSHVMESYFSNVRSAYLHARFGEAILNTLVTYGTKAYNEPDNYEARANVMWACTWAINGLLTKGNPVTWSMHSMDSELSAYFDITHGVGLAILMPAWMKWMLREENAYRYAEYARGVFGVDISRMSEMEAAKIAIEKTEEFFASLELPTKLRQVGIKEELLPEMAKNIGDKKLQKAFLPLDSDSILEIYKMAY